MGQVLFAPLDAATMDINTMKQRAYIHDTNIITEIEIVTYKYVLLLERLILAPTRHLRFARPITLSLKTEFLNMLIIAASIRYNIAWDFLPQTFPSFHLGTPLF
ncbi:Hypothetical_protein [Hexamita inflata]|uniref:Hypothetical_protein n=1 Tax=Hexamita inflata TaxID=28002 RepID=A0AA86TT11_9EUKA|nr:Hypothetical protein HINF_LOCUS13322 [Hexamita inflata]